MAQEAGLACGQRHTSPPPACSDRRLHPSRCRWGAGSVEALKQRKFGRVPTRSAARHALVADLNDLQQVRDKLAGELVAPSMLSGGGLGWARCGQSGKQAHTA